MSRGWPRPPDGPLAGAVVASQSRCWHDAIDLWRDLLRNDREVALAPACIAEAALHLGRHGLADQMLAQLERIPGYLQQLVSENHQRICVPREPVALLEQGLDCNAAIAAFRIEHPLGQKLRVMGDTTPDVSRRHSLPARLSAPKAKSVQSEIAALVRRKDMPALHDYAERLTKRPVSPVALHWAILGLRAVGIAENDPLYCTTLDRFSAVGLAGEGRGLVDARLYCRLGYPAFARQLLREALARSDRAKERARIRRRLAALAAERDRWLDDRTLLSAADFASAPERAALLALNRGSGADVRDVGASADKDPLEQAFDWLFAKELDGVEPYAPDNRLLMIGNTLGCGGMERMLARAYCHFATGDLFDRVDLALLEFADSGPSAFYAEEAGVSRSDIVLLDRDRDRVAGMPFSLLSGRWKIWAQKLFAQIRETRPRAIHAWNDLTGLLAAYAGLLAGCPKIIIHFHHAPGVPLAGRAVPIASYPSVYRKVRIRPEVTTLFCAEAAARDYAQWWRQPRDERFRVQYNGFDWTGPATDKTAAKSAAGLDAERPVVGTVMRFAPVKQPELWAEAAIALARHMPDIQFLMVGDGSLRETVAARFADADLADSLWLPGQVENVGDYLAAMDLFWLTSKTEGLPNTLIEAQFSGVPVVAFDVGGAGECFVDGASGALVPPDDNAALVERSLAILRDDAWRRAASQKSTVQARERFSADIFLEGLANLYAG